MLQLNDRKWHYGEFDKTNDNLIMSSKLKKIVGINRNMFMK